MQKSSAKASDAFQQRQQLIAAAMGGDADAQSRMGDLCREGDEYTKQDYSESLRWYALAAEQGDPNAQNNLGAMHENAMGVPKDMAEAAKWYRLSADQGLSTAQYNLGLRYLWGGGVEKDEREAAAWLHKAAMQGHVEALNDFGTSCRFGRGCERNIPMAAGMHTVAALAGDACAIGNLADYRDEIEREALGGSMLAALCLAKMYDKGLGVDENKAKMFAWLMWGGRKGTRDDGPNVREELIKMRGFHASALPDPVQDEAWKLFGQMWSPNAVVIDNRPRDAEGNVIHDEADYAAEPIAGGG